MADTQQLQHPQLTRPLQIEEDSQDLKKWELNPEEELHHLKVLLYGIPVLKDKEIVRDDEGNILYQKPPIVNSIGAEEIYNFVYEHTNKMIVLGFYNETTMNQQIYSAMVSFTSALLENYVRWQLEFSNVHGLFGTVYSLIYAAYSRGLNGNEKLYRAKTQTSHETKVINEDSTTRPEERKPGIVRRILGRGFK